MDKTLNNNSCHHSVEILRSLLEILPNAIVVCDKSGEIMFYNNLFVQTLPFSSVSVHEERGLVGEQLFAVVCESLSVQLNNISNYNSGEMLNNCVIRELEYNTSIYFLNNDEQFALIIRDCSNDEMIKEELKGQLEAVISENYLMVQEITQILGESTTKRIKLLNSFIKSLR